MKDWTHLEEYYNKYVKKDYDYMPEYKDIDTIHKLAVSETLGYSSFLWEKKWNAFKESIREAFRRKKKNPKHWFEVIICPECDHEQAAMVLKTFPWPSRVHECSKCKYVIMESEWNEKLEWNTGPPKSNYTKSEYVQVNEHIGRGQHE